MSFSISGERGKLSRHLADRIESKLMIDQYPHAARNPDVSSLRVEPTSFKFEKRDCYLARPGLTNFVLKACYTFCSDSVV
jgi:hypothetical protein